MLETSARRPDPSRWAVGSRRTSTGLVCTLVGMVVSALLLAGCSQDEPTAPKPTPTPLANLDTTSMRIPRIEFCALVPGAAVRRALDGKADSSSSYGNGDDVDLASVGHEGVHEIGCAWSTDAGATARAWLFARPVDATFARQAVASGQETAGCRVTRGPAYGAPSVT